MILVVILAYIHPLLALVSLNHPDLNIVTFNVHEAGADLNVFFRLGVKSVVFAIQAGDFEVEGLDGEVATDLLLGKRSDSLELLGDPYNDLLVLLVPAKFSECFVLVVGILGLWLLILLLFHSMCDIKNPECMAKLSHILGISIDIFQAVL